MIFLLKGIIVAVAFYFTLFKGFPWLISALIMEVKEDEIDNYIKGITKEKDPELFVYETSTYKLIQIIWGKEIYGMCKVYNDPKKEREFKIKEHLDEETTQVLHAFFARAFRNPTEVEERINHLHEMIGKVNMNDFSLEEQHELNRLKKRELRVLDCHYSFLSDDEKEKEKERFLHLLTQIEKRLHKTIEFKNTIGYEKAMKVAEKRYIK